MDTIFLKILNLSLTAGVIVLIVMILKLVFHRVPRWIHCVLWAIVALRLVCPWTPSSPFGILPADIVSVETVSEDEIVRADRNSDVLTTEKGISAENNTGNSDDMNIIYGKVEVPSVNTGISAVNDRINDSLKSSFMPSIGDSVNPIQVYSSVASWIWFSGMVCMLLYALFSWISVKRRVREAVPYVGKQPEKNENAKNEAEKNKERSFGRNIRIFSVDGAFSPFILGIFRPAVYLPASIPEDGEKVVLLHEKAHILRRDHWWKPFGFLLLTVYWFNPLMWVAYILLCRDIEMACDEKVMEILGEASGKKYSETLLALSMPRHGISACPVAFGEAGVKGRIRNILNYRKPAFWIVCISVAAVVVVAVVFLTKPGTKNVDAGELQATPSELSECGFLENASPETSAMTFYYYDGNKTTVKFLYDKEEEKRIIDEIDGLKVRKTDSSRAAEFKAPCYGLEICDRDGMEIWLTYSNGLWLLKNAEVYEAEFDFAKLYASFADIEPASVSDGGIGMLNSAILGEYDLQYYKKSDEMESERDGISLSIKEIDGDVATVTFTNDSDSEYGFGEYYTLQKKIDGVWYTLPVRLSNYAFNDILNILPAGQSRDSKCYLTMYGELEPGQYRIEKEKLVAEFNIGDAKNEGSADYTDLGWVKEYLGSLPNNLKTLEASGVLVNCDLSDRNRAEQIWNEFADNVNGGRPAAITIADFVQSNDENNTEDVGNALFIYIYYDGEKFHYAEDKSRGNFDITEEITLKTSSYLFSYVIYERSMMIVLTDDAELTYKKYESILQYAGYQELPKWDIFSDGGSWRTIDKTPVYEDRYSDIRLSDSGFPEGDYVTTVIRYVNPLSSSWADTGTEIYSFTDEGYSVYPRFSDDRTIAAISCKRISDGWLEPYTEEEWKEKTEMDVLNPDYYQKESIGDFKRLRFDNSTEVLMGNGRLLLMRLGNKMVWTIYELKHIES